MSVATADVIGPETTVGGNTTGTIIVVHSPGGTGRATAISIPRDSYVDIPGGYGRHEVNSAFSRARVDVAIALWAQGPSARSSRSGRREWGEPRSRRSNSTPD